MLAARYQLLQDFIPPPVWDPEPPVAFMVARPCQRWPVRFDVFYRLQKAASAVQCGSQQDEAESGLVHEMHPVHRAGPGRRKVYHVVIAR